MFETCVMWHGIYEVRDMRCVVLRMRNAVRCDIWCYGDMVIWPALQARAFELSLSLLLYLIVLWFVVVVVVVVVVRLPQKIRPIVHAAAGARACLSNGIWLICDFDFWHEKSI